jgi:hypothetical protein
MLVSTDNGAIHVVDAPVNLAGGIGASLDLRKDAVPEARPAPAVEAACDGGPRTVTLRQVPPRRTRAHDPQDAVDDLAMIGRRASGMGLLWQERLQSLPLFVG